MTLQVTLKIPDDLEEKVQRVLALLPMHRHTILLAAIRIGLQELEIEPNTVLKFLQTPNSNKTPQKVLRGTEGSTVPRVSPGDTTNHPVPQSTVSPGDTTNHLVSQRVMTNHPVPQSTVSPGDMGGPFVPPSDTKHPVMLPFMAQVIPDPIEPSVMFELVPDIGRAASMQKLQRDIEKALSPVDEPVPVEAPVADAPSELEGWLTEEGDLVVEEPETGARPKNDVEDFLSQIEDFEQEG